MASQKAGHSHMCVMLIEGVEPARAQGRPRAVPPRPIPLRKTTCFGGHVARSPRLRWSTPSSGRPLLYSTLKRCIMSASPVTPGVTTNAQTRKGGQFARIEKGKILLLFCSKRHGLLVHHPVPTESIAIRRDLNRNRLFRPRHVNHAQRSIPCDDEKKRHKWGRDEDAKRMGFLEGIRLHNRFHHLGWVRGNGCSSRKSSV